MTQTDNPNPKMKLPEIWAEKMSCPVCGDRPLGVFHPTGHADRFACGSCATSFELEEAGKRLRFVTLPQGVTPWMRGQWVILEEAMASFEVFKNEQASINADNPSEPGENTPAAEERVLTPEEIRMRPPVRTEQDEQAEFESRVREDMGEYLDDALLYATDKPDTSLSSTPPFFEEDFQPTEPKTEKKTNVPPEPVISKEPAQETASGPEPEPEPEPEPKPVAEPEPAQILPPVPELESKPEPKPESKPDTVPAAAVKSQVKPEEDVWKDEEIKRVKDALTNPPKGGFAGHLAQTETAILSEEEKSVAKGPEDKGPKPKVTASAVVPTVPVQPRQSTWSPEASTATRAPVKIPPVPNKKPQDAPVKKPPMDNKTPSPAPVEKSPSSVVTAPPGVSGVVPAPDNKDIEAIRTNITSGTMLTQPVDDRIQDAMERAVELQKLGNTDPEVRSILERSSGLTPDEVTQVLKNLAVPVERKNNNRILLVFLAAAVLIFAILTWWFFSNQAPGTPGEGAPTSEESESTGSLPGSLIEAASLPSPLQTLMPNGLRILNDPPLVDQTTAAQLPTANCPGSPAAAAKLFGGQAKEWSQDSATNGWMMMTTRQAAEVKIPANMTAGYLVFERGPEMRNVAGPAVVKNIYMISVACS